MWGGPRNEATYYMVHAVKWVVHGKKVDIIILTHNYYVSNTGVVTYMSRVEAFATRIKIESRDQGDLRTAKN